MQKQGPVSRGRVCLSQGGVCREQEQYRNRGKVVWFHMYWSVVPFVFYLVEIMFQTIVLTLVCGKTEACTALKIAEKHSHMSKHHCPSLSVFVSSRECV